MNCYLISCRGKQYATDGDNMLEAEEKFIETFLDADLDDFKITQVEVTPSLRDNEDIIWF